MVLRRGEALLGDFTAEQSVGRPVGPTDVEEILCRLRTELEAHVARILGADRYT
jgi:hypothetical protein